jgi:hypothetical protein
MKDQPTTHSLKNTARTTGLLYLFVIALAGFSQGYVRGNLIVPGNTELTALNILSHESLFRLGMVTDLTAFVLDAIISVLLYFLFKEVNAKLALIASALRLLAHPAIAALNLLNHYMAYEVLNGSAWAAAFDPAQVQAMALLFLEAHRYGYLIAGAFFGVHCFLLGILIYRSKRIPKVFGILMILAAIGYLMESFGVFLFPGNEHWLALLVGFSAAIGEVTLMFYLLLKGVRRQPAVVIHPL